MAKLKMNDGQELIYQDLNKIAPLMQRELYDRVVYEMLQRQSDAFFADSFSVSYVGPTALSVNAGVGFQNDSSQVSPEPTKRMLYLSSSQSKALSVPDASQNRIDIISVKASVAASLSELRKFKSAIDSTISDVTFDVEQDWGADIVITAGTPGVSPAVPATPSGYLKIAECLVHAVTGLGSQADVTDKRSKLPVGGDVLANTVGFQRMTAGSAVALSTILLDIDRLLKNGYQNYTDYDILGTDPAAPAVSSNKVRVYQKGGVFYFRDESGAITPIGSGGGGGGGGAWAAAEGTSPLEDSENGEKIFLFDKGSAGSQKLTLFLKIPQGYIPGRQIKMYIGLYSPATSGTILLKSTTYLVRKNNDAAGSTANSRASTNTALTNTVANQYREAVLDLSSSTGQVNSFSISPGDLLRVELTRGTDTDSNDIRFLPSATEVST